MYIIMQNLDVKEGNNSFVIKVTSSPKGQSIVQNMSSVKIPVSEFFLVICLEINYFISVPELLDY